MGCKDRSSTPLGCSAAGEGIQKPSGMVSWTRQDSSSGRPPKQMRYQQTCGGLSPRLCWWASRIHTASGLRNERDCESSLIRASDGEMTMPRTTTNSALIDALDRFEVCLETPLVPGEMEGWAESLRNAYHELAPVLNAHLRQVHRPMLAQIASEDPELLCHTEEIKHADQVTLETFDRLRQWVEQLPDVVAKIEPNEKRLEEHIGSLIRDGLELVMHIRKQETVLSTWHQEAMFRDRGTVD